MAEGHSQIFEEINFRDITVGMLPKVICGVRSKTDKKISKFYVYISQFIRYQFHYNKGSEDKTK